jgi:hypothetical protein
MPFEEPVKCDYCVLVSRAEQRRQADLWTIGLRERLPVIPIPLTAGQPEPELDLQAIVHHLYDTRGYAKFIYDLPPDPALSLEDNKWAQKCLGERIGS